MFDQVAMDIIHVTFEIELIPCLMFPETSLPQIGFTPPNSSITRHPGIMQRLKKESGVYHRNLAAETKRNEYKSSDEGVALGVSVGSVACLFRLTKSEMPPSSPASCEWSTGMVPIFSPEYVAL